MKINLLKLTAAAGIALAAGAVSADQNAKLVINGEIEIKTEAPAPEYLERRRVRKKSGGKVPGPLQLISDICYSNSYNNTGSKGVLLVKICQDIFG